MKKYEVTLYYHTMCTVTVKAENEEEALEMAYCEDVDEQLLENLQKDGSPDVELLEGNDDE